MLFEVSNFVLPILRFIFPRITISWSSVMHVYILGNHESEIATLCFLRSVHNILRDLSSFKTGFNQIVSFALNKRSVDYAAEAMKISGVPVEVWRHNSVY